MLRRQRGAGPWRLANAGAGARDRLRGGDQCFLRCARVCARGPPCAPAWARGRELGSAWNGGARPGSAWPRSAMLCPATLGSAAPEMAVLSPAAALSSAAPEMAVLGSAAPAAALRGKTSPALAALSAGVRRMRETWRPPARWGSDWLSGITSSAAAGPRAGLCGLGESVAWRHSVRARAARTQLALLNARRCARSTSPMPAAPNAPNCVRVSVLQVLTQNVITTRRWLA